LCYRSAAIVSGVRAHVMRVTEHLAVIGIMLGCAVLQTYPLVRHLDTHLPGLSLGDNMTFAWNVWWMREAITTGSSYFFSSALFAPFGTSLGLHTHTAFLAVIGALPLRPLSIPAALNVLVIGSVALNGYSAYVLSRQLGCRPRHALVAGVALLATPPVAARLMGHFNLVQVWSLVFACTYWLKWLEAPTRANALKLALTAALLCYCDYYYAVYFVVFCSITALHAPTVAFGRMAGPAEAGHHGRRFLSLPAVLVAVTTLGLAVALWIRIWHPPALVLFGTRVRLQSPTNAETVAWIAALAAIALKLRPRLRLSFPLTRFQRVHVRSAALATIVWLALTAPLIQSALGIWRSGDYVTQAGALKSSPSGVDVETLILGPPFNGITGPVVRRWYQDLSIDPMEGSAWIGVVLPVVLLTMTLGGVRLGRSGSYWRRSAVVFGLWALGPYLVVLGTQTGILLPGAAIHFVPVINNARIPGRALVMVAFALSMMLALKLNQRNGRFVSVVLALALLGESTAAPMPLAPLPDDAAYAAIAADPSHSAVLTIPFGARDGFRDAGRFDTEALFAQTVHRHPIVGGFVARLSPRTRAWYERTEPYASLIAIAERRPAPLPACADVQRGLNQAGVGYVVVYPTRARDLEIDALLKQMTLTRVYADSHVELFVRDTGTVCDEPAR
jgi:hypothetical protein